LVGSHVSSVHALPSSTETGVPGVHVPDKQVSPVVHTSPALHPVPSGAVGLEQVPAVGSQVPTW